MAWHVGLRHLRSASAVIHALDHRCPLLLGQEHSRAVLADTVFQLRIRSAVADMSRGVQLDK